MKRIREKEPRFYREIVRQKLAYAGHVLRGSGGRNALKRTCKGKKAKTEENVEIECGLTTSGNAKRSW